MNRTAWAGSAPACARTDHDVSAAEDSPRMVAHTTRTGGQDNSGSQAAAQRRSRCISLARTTASRRSLRALSPPDDHDRSAAAGILDEYSHPRFLSHHGWE